MHDLIMRAARDLVQSRHAIALTGAGISTESGIPDFRGPDGIWTKNPEAERRAYEAYTKFINDPAGYWEETMNSGSVLGELGRYLPNPGHYALSELEKLGVLKCVVTQNVDNLHRKAGSINVLEYHGNAFKLRCLQCTSRYEEDNFDLQSQMPPLCLNCGEVLKYDVVYFGEPIPEDVALHSIDEAGKSDLMLICGTSAVVYPFANLPLIGRRNKAVIIEINAEPTPLTHNHISDYLIRGKTGAILPGILNEVKKLTAKE
ncbi:MAG: SIR2 family NAD-dependent protein deacylase [Bacillota bacterium]